MSALTNTPYDWSSFTNKHFVEQCFTLCKGTILHLAFEDGKTIEVPALVAAIYGVLLQRFVRNGKLIFTSDIIRPISSTGITANWLHQLETRAVRQLFPACAKTYVENKFPISHNFTKEQIYENLLFGQSTLANCITHYLTEYAETSSLEDIIELFDSGILNKIPPLDVDAILQDKGIYGLEQAIKKDRDRVVKFLKQEPNPFRDALHSGSINAQQFYQFIRIGGTRTTLVERMSDRPIFGNYSLGLWGIKDTFLDALAGMKAHMYSKNKMGPASYKSRQIQLACMGLEKIQFEDCGSVGGVYYDIPKEKQEYERYLYKNIYKEDGSLLQLTLENISDFAGKRVYGKSPVLCRVQNGICVTCGGGLYEALPEHEHPGITAVQETIRDILQKVVLSAKHNVQTRMQTASIPENCFPYFDLEGQDIFLKESLRGKVGFFRIPLRCAQSLPAIRYARVDAMEPRNFSRILSLQMVIEGEVSETLTFTESTKTQDVPFLTLEQLVVLQPVIGQIIKNPDSFDIPFSLLDLQKPIFSFPSVSFGAQKYVTSIQDLIYKDLATMTTYNDALKEIEAVTSMVLKPNISHVELVLRGFLVKSINDYSIPVLTEADLSNITLGTVSRIVKYRSLGPALAFEKHVEQFLTPRFYNINRTPVNFDKFLSLKADCEEIEEVSYPARE